MAPFRYSDDDHFEVYMIIDQTIRASKIQMNEINPKNMDTQHSDMQLTKLVA